MSKEEKVRNNQMAGNLKSSLNNYDAKHVANKIVGMLVKGCAINNNSTSLEIGCNFLYLMQKYNWNLKLLLGS